MRARTTGFTLLEAMVAMGILALALMGIFDINAGAVRMHSYTKKVSVATLLARSKMTDLEQELFDKGFSADDDEESGDFSAEGFSTFKWRAKILAPKTTGVSTDQLLAAIFNVPVDGEGGDDGMSAIAAMFGGAGGGAPPGGGPTPAGGGMAGMMGGLAQTQMTQFLDQISKTVREVHLTVSWREGKVVESIDLVTHIVSLGVGSDRNGAVVNTATQFNQQFSQGAIPQAGGYCTPQGVPVPNAQSDGQGNMINPATRERLISCSAADSIRQRMGVGR